MTFKKSLKNFASARAVTLGVAVCAALLTASCATDQAEFTDQHWKSTVAAGSEPLIAPSGTLSANTPRKIALRQLAENSIRSDAPDAYTVVKGDTLWDISGRFLSRPWLWPEIWQVNPQIENPHLIYPGDRIALAYVDGAPRLQLIRANSRPARQSTPIGTIPTAAIENFLVNPAVVSKAELQNSAYVAATQEGRLISSATDHIYARGELQGGSRYSIYRPGKALTDPDSKEVLGYEALHVSNASLVKAGDPAKLIITDSKRETLVGDRLMNNDAPAPVYFTPRAAATDKPGKVISIVDAIARAGSNQVVVLNLGASDGVAEGDTFAVNSNARVVRDVINQSKSEYFTVEGDQSAVVMVFRTFDRISYGLIMSSTRAVKLYDQVVSTANQL